MSLLVTEFARNPEQTAAVLNVRDLHVSYHTAAGPVRAVNGVSFFLRPGERFGLVGESGSGKTTAALSLMRLLQESAVIESGEVLLDGVDLLRLSEEAMRQARFAEIALIPQGAMNSLNPMMKVGEQLRDTISAHRKGMDSGSVRWRPDTGSSAMGWLSTPAPRPSASNVRSASRMGVLLTRKRVARSASTSRSPGCSSPKTIRSRNAA